MLHPLVCNSTKKKHLHGSLIIKDSIATKMKGYLFEDAFPKRNVNKYLITPHHKECLDIN